MKQITKVKSRIKALENHEVCVDRNAPRRCRTCRQTEMKCDGLCWGFWKTSKSSSQENQSNTCGKKIPPNLSIEIGDVVEPGPHWNQYRLGRKSLFKKGKVVERKSWYSGGEKDDCVSVKWEFDNESKNYRWGAIDKCGQRQYDVQIAL